jgi:hypothetical protein
MPRLAHCASATFFVLALLSTTGQAKRLMPIAPSIPNRVAAAETIVLGKVDRIEGQSVEVSESPHEKEKKEYFVAMVRIEEAVKGAVGLTDLKVAFPAMPANSKNIPNGGDDYRLQLETNQEVCLFLKPHHSGKFLVAACYYPSFDKKDTNFEKNWKWTQQCGKLLANPEKGLQAKDSDERFLTAAMLILQYRTRQFMPKADAKEEPIPANQSQLILQALAEANWEKPKEDLGYEMRPESLFSRLNLTPKDGWNQAVTSDAAKKWLKENAERYRIKRFLAESI